MRPRSLVLSLLLVTFASSTPADTVKDREGAVRSDRATLESDARWIYNDYRRGFALARQTGKPVLVVLRCIPCLACAGLDAQVLLQETDLSPLLEQFVCVRVINANALDLALFQFDYDLSFTTMFFNGDGTVYGRYGSWRHQKDAQDKTTAGFKRALEGALALHRAYPANQSALGGKQGAPTGFRTPVNIPTLSEKYTLDLNWDGKVVPSCIHCHQISDALRLTYRDKGQPMPDEWVYFWPPPETLGFTLSAEHAARVESVVSGSPAERSGLRPGDDLSSLAGQPLISIADVTWVLHRAPASGALVALVKRDGAERTVKLALPADWRRKADISRRVGTWPMRGMVTGGLVLDDLDDEERRRRGLGHDGMALLVKSVGQYGKHAAAKNAGFQKDDLIVQLAGESARRTESEMIGHLLRNHQAGDQVQATVLRGDERIELSLPMQ
jgi:serine protease Do